LRAAADLATGHERLWRPVATSLLSCKQAGRAGTISIAERWPCSGSGSADTDAIVIHLQSVALPECATAVKWSVCMAALHEGRLAEALALAPPHDSASPRAFAPYLLAAMRQHAMSSAPLSEPPAVLVTVAELAETFMAAEDPATGASRHGSQQPYGTRGNVKGAGWRRKTWECVVAYARLCQACAALADVQHPSGHFSDHKSVMPKRTAMSTAPMRGKRWYTRVCPLLVFAVAVLMLVCNGPGSCADFGVCDVAGAVQQATLVLLDDCPADVALRTLHKLHPLMLPEQEIFSSSDLHHFVQWMQDACMHGGQDAQLQTAEDEAIRTELLTACVLTTAA
jgi:hypothetical protein